MGVDAAAGDDVATHELTHGITSYTSNLAYTYQSGAINESMSDVFGEFEDQLFAVPGSNDEPRNDWLFGEDEAEYDPVRSLADPTKVLGAKGYRSPDRMHSPYYFVSGDDVDPGDVLASLSGVTLACDPDRRDQAGRMLDLLMDGLRYRR